MCFFKIKINREKIIKTSEVHEFLFLIHCQQFSKLYEKKRKKFCFFFNFILK